MNKLEKFLLAANLLLYGFLAVFSYSYVDLNLTISQNPLALRFVEIMKQLGYFHRTAATITYVIFLFIAFSFFVVNLVLFYKSKISVQYLKWSTIINTLILIFAYPFLSSDLFNYMFDAKIILKYHASPYTHRALDFPHDDWIRFMRWIHRYSPYGPLWLGASLIPAFLGFGKFVGYLISFKIFIGAFHLINTGLIYKTLQKLNSKNTNFYTALYALNPLFLIEGVANAHNDMVLAALLISSIYFLTKGSAIKSYTLVIAGTLIKYIPALTLPWFIWQAFLKKGNRYSKLILANLATLAVFTFVYSTFRITVPFVSSGATQVQFQPWYLFWTLPFVSLVSSVELLSLSIAIAIGASLRYLPFLYLGDWSHQGTIQFMQAVTFAPALITATFLVIRLLKKR